MPRQNQIQFRKGTGSEWTNENPVLASGEPGYEADTNRLKIGLGLNWDDTSYISSDSLVTTVYNNKPYTISGFNVVYIDSGQGNKPTIGLSIASGEASSARTYGITINDISSNSNGLVITNGLLKNLNTNQFGINKEGSSLWLSPTVSGGITLTKPYAPNHAVFVGTIVRSHNTQGSVEVKIQNGYELEELHNVATTGATNGQFLQYNSASELWISSSSGNFTNLTINNNQIVTGTGIANHIAYWNSTSGIVADSGQLVWDSTNNRLGIGTTSPTSTLQVSGLITANSGTFQIINVTGPTTIFSDSLVSFTHPDNTGSSDYDVIISGQLHLTRNANNGIYNLATEASWNQSLSPSGTLWNNEGWSNLINFKSRTYSALWSAVGGGLGNNLPNAELIMKHVPTNRYWKVKFTSWTQGGGGGFAYERQEIFVDNAINVSGNSNFNDILTANVLSASGVSCERLSVIGEDLTYGGQPPSITLKGYSWFGKVDGSAGIAVTAANSGTFGSSSAFASFGGFNENATIYTPIHFAANNSAQLYLNTDGNVGINTAIPSYKLDINGTIGVTGIARFNNDIYITDNSKSISWDSGSEYIGTQNDSIIIGTQSTTKMLVNGSGYIGIGTITPNAQLHVIGSGIFSSGLIVSGLLTSDSGNFTNSLQVNGTGVSLTSHSHGNITSSGTIGSTSGLLVVTTSSGLLTTTSGISSSLITNFNSSVSGLLPVGTANYLSKFGTGGSGLSNSLIFDNGTNVGIGTTNPQNAVHISGSSTAAIGIKFDNGDGYGGSINADNGQLYFVGSNSSTVCRMTSSKIRMGDGGAGATAIELTSNGTISQDGNGGGLSFSGTNARFSNGINVTGSGLFTSIDINNSAIAGSAALTVNGNIITQNNVIRGGTFSIYGDNNTRIYKADGSTLNYSVSSSGYNHSLGYDVSGSHTSWMTINNTGVGIGTSSPTSKLHVAGDVLATGSFIGGSGTASLPSFEFVNDPDTGLFSPATNTIGLATSGVERLRINNVGNVGIGTTGPTTTLHVNGSFSCGAGGDPSEGGQGLYLDPLVPSLIFNDSSGPLTTVTIDNNGLTLHDSTSTAFFYTDRTNARIGIGTATPDSTLHVVGTSLFSNVVQIGSIGENPGILNIYTNDASDLPATINLKNGSGANRLSITVNDDSVSSEIISTSDILYLTNDTRTINIMANQTNIIGNMDIDGNLSFNSFTESVVAIGNSSTSKTISLTSGTVQTCTLTGNCTFTMPTATAGKSFSLFLNSGSGNYTASFSGVRWADSATPTATILANKVDIYSFISDGSYWYGSFSQNYG